jgi:hypothetical protein
VKVYVAEQGCYSDRSVVGVYDSLERAMAALPGKKWKHAEIMTANYWTNELDWDDFVEIMEMEVVDA